MAVHPVATDPWVYPLLLLSILVCIPGLWALFSRWGHGKMRVFFFEWAGELLARGPGVFMRTLLFDVLLFRRVWKRSRGRWAVHMAMFWGFAIFAVLVAISMVSTFLVFIDPEGPGNGFASFLTSLHVPYDLLGYVILAGSGIALARRVFIKNVREETNFADIVLILGVFVIALSGIAAEWFSGYATGIGKVYLNWDLALDFQSLHVIATFFFFIALLPWSKFRHIIATPLLVLVRGGGE